MFLGGILEWILGNSFTSVVFLTFGAFWLSFGGTLSPSFAAWASFAAEGEPAASGLQARGFNASFGESADDGEPVLLLLLLLVAKLERAGPGPFLFLTWDRFLLDLYGCRVCLLPAG